MSQEIYTKYASDKSILKKIYEAKDFEEEHLNGHDLGDNVKLKAWIGKETGLWEVLLDLPYGKVFFTSLNSEITKVDVTSIENKLVLIPPGLREFEIDLKDASSIKTVKEYFLKDPVLNNTFIDTYEGRSAAEVLPVLIKSFRKKYLSYSKQYDFLWKNTSANSAMTLFEEMQKVNLVYVQ